MNYCKDFDTFIFALDSIDNPVVLINDFSESIRFELWDDTSTTRSYFKF